MVPVNLSPPRVITNGIARHFSLERLDRVMPVSDGTRVFVRDDGPVKREDLLLNTQEARLFELALKGEAVAQLVAAAGERVDALRLLYALFLLEVIGFKGMIRGAVEERVERTRRPEPEKARSVVVAEEGPSFAKEIARLEEADYFELLGVGRDASTDDIHAAFRTRVKRFHPDNVGKLSEEIQTKALKLYRRMVDGYQILANPGKRAEYLKSLTTSRGDGARSAKPRREHLGRARDATQQDEAKERVDEVIAQVHAAIDEERYKDALSLLKAAKRENPDDVRCLAWYGWVLYLDHPVTDLHEAERQLATARSLDPSHPVPYRLMARLRAREGAIDQARELYSQALAKAPGDREIAAELDRLDSGRKGASADAPGDGDATGETERSGLRGVFKRLPFGRKG